MNQTRYEILLWVVYYVRRGERNYGLHLISVGRTQTISNYHATISQRFEATFSLVRLWLVVSLVTDIFRV
jgi:hypothetical protein